MAFLGSDYLISNAAGLRIFEAVKDLPVVDPHNHADVRELALNRPYANAWQLFGATDHYVWEVMRKRSVSEAQITGAAPDEEKFLALARIAPELAGNPVYEWVHLDLRRVFGIDDELSEATGAKVWREVNARLATPEFLPQAILRRLNVEVMSSTDDPVDTLEWHDRLNAEFGRTVVRPTWRPDRAMRIAYPDWSEYLVGLGERYGRKIDSFKTMIEVLAESHAFFAAKGCRASDHALVVPPRCCGSFEAAEAAFRKRLAGEELEDAEVQSFTGTFMGEVAALNAAAGFVTQLHIGSVRDVRGTLLRDLGKDCGGDVMDHHIDYLPGLVSLLNRFDDRLKVVLYCMSPEHQSTLASLTRAFGEKAALGSAWWQNDTPIGMRRQLEFIGSIDLLSNFGGMVSDSRKLLSFGSRFEMFRRVLSDRLGALVEAGQAPEPVACALAVSMAYSQVKRFWNL